MSPQQSVRFVVLFLSALPMGVFADEHQLVSWKTERLSDVFFSEGADAGDFNGDGNMDVVSGPFWYAGPDFKNKFAYTAPKPFDPHGYSDNFFAYTEDFNRDGWTDILIVGFPGKEAFWYENPEGRSEGLWERHLILDVVDNESPQFADLTGDGVRELVCSTGGYFGYATPQSDEPLAPWTFHRISDQSAGGRFTHGLGIGDVDGDGRPDLLEKRGWWQQPQSSDDAAWTFHPVPFSGPGGAQMFAYDFDGDGDADVLTSLAAHGYGLAWYEQQQQDGQIVFTAHRIMGEHPDDNSYGVAISQLHAVELVDIDGDGVKDIVTGKRYWAHGPTGDPDPTAAPVIYWFRTIRKHADDGGVPVDFEPWLIDDDSGVGTEVSIADLNGDDLPDVIVGNKRGTYVHVQQRKAVSQTEWLRRLPLSRATSAQPVERGVAKHDGLTAPEAALAMTVPQGFQVSLVAAEPDVHQPIAFALDAAGRIWVAEAHTYPQRAPDGEGRDRIIILEDADGDGTWETSTTFIEGLNLVSGLEVGHGGVWVGAAPNLLFIPDRDGDDRPDGEPEVVLDGWGYHDTHETLNAFTWGPDGWLYGCHGVFTHSRIGVPGTPDDQRTALNAGVWRFHPVRRQFEVFAEGTSNPWGVDFNDIGEAFITACVIPHLYHIVPGARYQRQAGQHFDTHTYDDIKTIADHAHYAGSIRDHAWWGRNEAVAHDETDLAGGGHAHCGAMIYLGDNWPTAYRDSICMFNVHGNRMNRDVLDRHGSGYIGRHAPDVLFANDRWFRGINMRYGPDGGVYFIDWYDRNACHRNQPEIWDRSNGRIYKLSYGTPEASHDDLPSKTDAELVALHLHENDWYVRTARRLLSERAVAGDIEQSAVHELHAILSSHEDVTRRLRALWTLHAAGQIQDGELAELLDDQDDAVRMWAVRLLFEDGTAPPTADAALLGLAGDSSARVRRELASAVQRMPYDKRRPLVARLLANADDANDHNLPLLIWYATSPLVDADPAGALELAASSRIPTVTRFIYRQAAESPEGLHALLEQLTQTEQESRQAVMLDEIAAVVKTRGKLAMPANWPQAYRRLAASSSEEIRRQARFITVKFGDKSIFPVLRSIVRDDEADVTARRDALQALSAGKDDELPPLLFALLDSPLAADAVRTLAGYDHPETPERLLARFKDWTTSEKSLAVGTLASRTTYAHALLDAVAAGRIERNDLDAVTAAQLQRLNDPDLIEKLNTHWGAVRATPEVKRQLIAEYKSMLTEEKLRDSDRSRGRQVFAETCAKCHQLFAVGGKIGPNLTGSNRSNLDYLLENILDPSAVVGKDYQTTVVLTVDGRVVSGLLKEENESALVLQTIDAVVVVPKNEIDERSVQPVSIMPEGQLKTLAPDDAVALIAYLAGPSQVPLPGAVPPLDPDTGRVAGALEGETLKIIRTSGGAARPQPMASFTKDRWSGASHLWWTGAKPGDTLELEFSVDKDGTYDIFTVLTKARDYGIVSLSLDGEPTPGPMDLFHSPDVITTGILSLGTTPLNAGSHRLTVRIVGANPQSVPAFMFGLDYLYLAPSKTKDR